MGFALITGASKGIGKSIAWQLAGRGIDVLLVARSEEALKTLAEALASAHNIKAFYLAADLSDPKVPQQVLEWTRQHNYPVQYLVNNAGYGLSGSFEQYDLKEHLNNMEVNMNAVVALTYLFLPQLKQQQQAYIMNIASSAAYQAVPYMSVYAATKAFVLQFSRGLHHELKPTSVSVTAVSPGATDTDFANRAKVGPKGLKLAERFNMNADLVAKIAIDAMFRRQPEVVTGFVNKLGVFMAWLLPKKTVEKASAKIYE